MKNMIEGAAILKLNQLIITITVIFTFYSVILILIIYLLGGIDLIYSASLIFAAITGGGFVPQSTYLAVNNVMQLMPLIVGMIISALPFAFHYGVFSRQVKARKVGLEIFVFAMIMISSIPIFVILEPHLGQQNWFASIFHVVSASTTTGFQFLNLSEFSIESKILLMLLMLIGGCAFSTASGIKIARLIFIFQKVFNRGKSPTKENISYISNDQISRKTTTIPSIASANIQSHSQSHNLNSISNIKRKSHSLSSDKAFKEALLVIALFFSLSFVSGISIKYLTNTSFIDALFESVSASTNTGLSIGITNVELDSVSKSILITNMIMGRFEIITILYIFFNFLRR
jgi:trk system potassium uptake protein